MPLYFLLTFKGIHIILQVFLNYPPLAPCGEVCSYSEQIGNASGMAYPELYKQINCDDIMRRMAYRRHRIEYPPPLYPPDALIPNFTMNGQMPIREVMYFMPIHTKTVCKFRKKYIYKVTEKILKGEQVNTYRSGTCVEDTLKEYINEFKGKRSVVIGTIRPWLEALLMVYGGRNVITLEYNECDVNVDQLEVHTPYDFAEKYLRGTVDQFDFGVTFSSLEHSGLGRYTDPINPYGDLEAMAQIWCMLKPGGILLLGIPCVDHDNGYIVWNAHRVYGIKRLQQMTANWRVLQVIKCEDFHVVYVLRKLLF